MKDFQSISKSQVFTREQLKAIRGGDGGYYGGGGNYKCCTSDYSVCGQCDSNGNGGCQGNGVAVYCVPGSIIN